MKFINNIRLRYKLIGGFVIIAILLLVVAVFSLINMNLINNGMENMYQENLIPTTILDSINETVTFMRGDIYKYMLYENNRDSTRESMVEKQNDVIVSIETYQLSTTNEEVLTYLEQLDAAWQEMIQEKDVFLDDVDNLTTDIDPKSLASWEEFSVKKETVTGLLETMLALNEEIAAQTRQESNETLNHSRISLMIITLIGFLLAIGLGIILSSSIITPINTIKIASQRISEGDLIRDMAQEEKDSVNKRGDEIGDIAKAFDSLVIYIQNMAEAAQEMANRNLSIDITPKSDHDEFGITFSNMVSNLRKIILSITDDSDNVNNAAQKLSTAALQAGEATNQIAQTIQ